jgi:hypothetical protein
MNRRLPETAREVALSSIAAVLLSVTGVLIISAALAMVPSLVVACLLFAFAANWCESRIECMLFNRGSRPMGRTGLRARLRAQIDAYRAAAPAQAASTKDARQSQVIEPAEVPADSSVTAESLSEEIYELRLLLEVERELTAVLIGDLSPEQVTGEDE